MRSGLMKFCILLLVTALTTLGVEKRSTELVKVKIRAFDANNRLVNDMRQEEFTLQVDDATQEPELWIKDQDFLHRSTYTIIFKPNRSSPQRPHQIEVQVTRQNIRLRYPASLIY